MPPGKDVVTNAVGQKYSLDFPLPMLLDDVYWTYYNT